MTWPIILQIILFGIALSADAFSVAVTEGLTFSNMNKKKGVFIAATFGICQGLFPLIGYWIVEGASELLGSTVGDKVGSVLSVTVTWVAFGLLLIIGTKMIIDSIKEIKEIKTKDEKQFSVKEVLMMGVVTAIDALATGVAFHNVDSNGVAISTNVTIWLHVSIIAAITFIISLLGIIFGNFFLKLFKGKVEITGIIGGSILVLLAVWIVVSHYVGL